jgi:outer membrane receptor protein involved in Fe transport
VRHRRIVANQLVGGALLEYAWLPAFSYGQNFCCGEAYTYAGPTLRNWDQLPLTQLHKDRLNAATLVHDQLQPWSWLWITAGVRFDWYSDFGSTWNPRVGIVARPHPKISFKLLYGRAFRAPSFRELYDQTGASETAGGLRIMGNPTLEPEITDTVETGFETTPWHLVTLRANAFYTRISDSIDVDATFTVGGARVVNFPGVQLWGGEAELQLHLDEENYLSANLSYVERRELGQGLPGFETDAERRFITTQLNDVPRLRVNLYGAATPLHRLKLPRTLARMTVGMTYSFVAGLANNNRFTFEALSVFRQGPYSELRGNVIAPFWRGRVDVNFTFALSFARTIAVPLTAGWYDLATNAVDLFLGVRLHE